MYAPSTFCNPRRFSLFFVATVAVSSVSASFRPDLLRERDAVESHAEEKAEGWKEGRIVASCSDLKSARRLRLWLWLNGVDLEMNENTSFNTILIG